MICRSGCQQFVKFTYAENPESEFVVLHYGLYLTNGLSNGFKTLNTVALRYVDLIYAIKFFLIFVRRSRVLSNPVTFFISDTACQSLHSPRILVKYHILSLQISSIFCELHNGYFRVASINDCTKISSRS